ncbi:MAG: metallophosphoesterase family protein [Oscillochloris sp.]|nr:metallophosphoesterase family protein [Oscillochloris sp.]
MSLPVVLGIVSDLHGDIDGFTRALEIFVREQVSHVICAGDLVDRGADADRIAYLLRQLQATCVKGNHEHTIARSQERWRASGRTAQLAQVGRIINDETLAYITELPDTARRTFAGMRLLVAHGAPWSDIASVFPNSRQATFERLVTGFQETTDTIILGHTHRPMHVRIGSLQILNPGSVYGVTARDSHTCATLTVPTQAYQVFDLRSGAPIDLPVTLR